MADLFGENIPADTDNVSEGASVIRTFKAKANLLLSQIFTATGAVAEFAVKVTQIVAADTGRWLEGSQIQRTLDSVDPTPDPLLPVDTNDADRSIGTTHIKTRSLISRHFYPASVTPAAVAHAAYAYQTATWEKDATTDTYVVDAEMTPAVTTLVDGARYWFRADVSNDASPFLKLGTSAASKAMVGPEGAVLSSGQIAAGQVVEVVYRLVSDNFQIISTPSAAVNTSASAFVVFNGTAEIAQDTILSSGSSIFNGAALNSSFATGTVVAIYNRSGPGSDFVSGISPALAGDPKYLRKVSTTSFSLHPTKADAIANTNAIVYTFSAPVSRNLSVATIPVLDGFNVDGVVHNAATVNVGTNLNNRQRPGSFSIVFSAPIASAVAAISGAGSTTGVYASGSTGTTDTNIRYSRPLSFMFDPEVIPSTTKQGVLFAAVDSSTSIGSGPGVDPVRASVVVHAL